MTLKSQKRYTPTYRIARTLATLAAELMNPPRRMSFERARELMNGLANASSDKTFSRYTKALREVFDGVQQPILEVDSERRELRLAGRPTTDRRQGSVTQDSRTEHIGGEK
jgi:hypothetical protein